MVFVKHRYGRNMATGDEVEVGEAVGTVALNLSVNLVLSLRCVLSIPVGLPETISHKVFLVCQEIFEARNPKGRATITEVTGVIQSVEENPAERTKEVTVQGETDTRTYSLPFTSVLKVKEGDYVHRGEALTVGSIDPKELIKVRDVLSTENYILREVQKVYRMQGVEISDKHVEVMARQMLRKVRIMDPGDTNMLPGTLMDINDFKDNNVDTLIQRRYPSNSTSCPSWYHQGFLGNKQFLICCFLPRNNTCPN